MLDRIREIFDIVNNIPNPPYEYDFLINLNEKEYPKYLKKIFKAMTGESLNLKHPKTFNEKIQWLKLYDCTPLKTQLTDKVLVRDWVKNKIGENYLKPCLQVCSCFEEIDFKILPNSFFIKCNHGCKWHFKIKDKEKFLLNKEMYNSIKIIFDNWLSQSFFPWAGFELQYKNIIPKILIEPVLTNKNDEIPTEVEIYCFNRVPKFFQQIKYSYPPISCVYDENYKEADFTFNSGYIRKYSKPDEKLIKIVELSKVLAQEFKLVRVDWILYQNKIYFNEMTFTPFSGFFTFFDEKINKELGNKLKLKE